VTAAPTDFLYPPAGDGAGVPAAVLADLARSAEAKIADSVVLRRGVLTRYADALERAGAAMAVRLGRGGTVFAVGNGGSATDAAALVGLFARPPHGRPVRARCLAADPAILSALANDVGVDAVFSRQLDAYAGPDDVVVGFSTSGDSANVLHAFAGAARAGLLTVGLAGYEGGRMADAAVDHLFVVPSQSVHRVQEAQDALALALWTAVQRHLGGAAAPT